MFDTLIVVGTFINSFATIALVYLVTKQWKGDALHRLHERLIEPETQQALRTIFAANPEEFLDPDDTRLRDAAERVLNLYDLIGKRIQADTIPKDAVLDSEWPTILRVAQQIGMFLQKERERRHTIYKDGFAWLLTEIRGDNAIVESIREGNPNAPINPWTKLPTIPVYGIQGYRNSRPCVAVFIRRADRAVLLLERASEPHGWETPGGFLNEGEHPEDGARREVKEETQLDVPLLKLIDIQMGDYSGRFKTLNLCYVADIQGDGADLKLSEESKSSKWVTRDEIGAQQLAFPWVKDAAAKI